MKWVDLEALSQEVASKAADITGMLSGEPAKAYTVQAPGAAPVAEEEVPAQLIMQSSVSLLQSSDTLLHVDKQAHKQLHLQQVIQLASLLVVPGACARCVGSCE